jgi:hypothetical protein
MATLTPEVEVWLIEVLPPDMVIVDIEEGTYTLTTKLPLLGRLKGSQVRQGL